MKILLEGKGEQVTLPENMHEVFSWKVKRRIFIISNILSSVGFGLFTVINIDFLRSFFRMYSVLEIMFFILLFVTFIVGYVFLHELVHFIAYPGNPFSNDKTLVIGKYAVSAYYDGSTSYCRILYVLALPVISISIVSLLIHYFFIGGQSVVFNLLFLTHIVLSSADVVVFVLYLVFKPKDVLYYGNYYIKK